MLVLYRSCHSVPNPSFGQARLIGRDDHKAGFRSHETLGKGILSDLGWAATLGQMRLPQEIMTAPELFFSGALNRINQAKL
jgi:hypothetical protein